MQSSPNPSTTGYAWALLATGLAALVRAAFEPVLGDVGHFIPFYLAVAVVAALRGWRPGLLALALGGLGGFMLFIYWPGRFHGHEVRSFVQLGFYLFVGGTIAALAEWGRRQRDDALRRFEEHDARLKLFDLANVLMLDLEHRILRWTVGCQRLYGYTAEQALGRVSHELLKTTFPEPLEQIRAQLRTTGRWSGELRHQAADGRELIIASEWVLHRDLDGAPAGILEDNTDITGRVRLEEQLYAVALFPEENPTPVLRIDAARSIMYANPPARSLLAPLPDGANAAFLDALSAEAAAALQHGQQHETEFECARGRVFSFVFVPVPTKGYINLYGRDVTAIRRTERALRASEERYRCLFESMDEGFALHEMIFDDAGRPIDYRFLEVNPAFDRLTGLKAAEVVGRTIREVVPGVEPSWIENYGRVVLSGQSTRFDGFVADLGRWFEVYAYCPAPGEFAVVFSDITERKRSEAALRQSEDDLNRAQAVAQTGSWRLDVRRNELIWSDEAHRIFGIPRGTPLTYETFLSAVHPEDRVLVDDAWQAALRGGFYDVEHRVVVGDDVKWVREKAELEFDADGKLRGGFGATQDITERKRFEQELAAAKAAAEAAKEAAEAANVAKSQFLANMSHELRTPMNAILGMTEAALEEPLTGDVRDALETVKESADGLMELLNEILDLSRIEAGALQLEWAPFSLRELLDKTLKTFRARAHEKKLTLSRDVPDGVPDALLGDALRVRQIVTNLVSNAIKFTPQGEVAIQVAVVDETSKTLCLECRVVDTGIGIAPEHVDRIFSPFTQADASTTRQFGGTGLGLTICRRLVELMNGTISVESRLGFGSTFRFFIWLGKDKTPATAARKLPPHLAGQPILVVDDNDNSRRALEEMLRGWGLMPDAARDVPVALTKLHQAATADQPFVLVVANAVMAQIDGYTLAGWIRNEPQLAGGIVLMAPPGDAFAVKRCQELGAGHLEKPVAQAELLDAIVKLLGDASRARPALVAPSRPSPERALRILLAEDTPANRKVVTRILEKRGHRVEAVDNGGAALQCVIDAEFDLVLMDVQMPGMDGFAATAAIRELPDARKARVPIVAMTAHALKGDEQRCLAAGMDSYIAKPVHAQRLIETIERLGNGGGGAI